MKAINIVSKIATFWTVFYYYSLVLYRIQASSQFSIDQLLSLGDEALSNDNVVESIEYYNEAITIYEYYRKESQKTTSIVTIISLYTNKATALSALGKTDDAVSAYETALTEYQETIKKRIGSIKKNK